MRVVAHGQCAMAASPPGKLSAVHLTPNGFVCLAIGQLGSLLAGSAKCRYNDGILPTPM
jgi:hypothetical protein